MATFAFIGLLFTIHNYIHNRDKRNSSANLTDIRSKPFHFFSTLADKNTVENDGGTVIDGAFDKGGCSTGFISKGKGEVIIFPIGRLTNMKAGTVALCVTLKKKLVDTYDYDLFMIDDYTDAIFLQIAWNKRGFHNVRLRIKPGDSSGIKKGARALTPKINWQPGEHHHIAATWGAEGIYVYIDGKVEGKHEDNVEGGRENFDKPFAVNNSHPDRERAKAPTYCIISNLQVSNYQKSDREIGENYATLHNIKTKPE